MATQVQFRGGTTSEHSSFTGVSREITIDTDKDTIVVHDGTTAGGFPLASEKGAAFTGNVTFGDNVKAIFGAGSDLQIYHSGSDSHSYIIESGGGSLYIQGTELNLTNATGTSTYANFVDGGAAFIRHAGSTKLATTATGIDVTGTAVTDGLTVAGNVSVNGGTITSDGLTVDGATLVQAGNGATATLSLNNADGNGTMSQLNLGYTADPDHGNIKYTGDMLFHTGGNNERMRIDSSGNFMVGHTSAFSPIGNGGSGVTATASGQLFAGHAGPPLYLNREDSDGDIAVFRKDGISVASIGSVASGANLYMSAASGVGLGIGGDNLYPVNAAGASTDGSLDIGDASAKFKDLYLSGGVYLGGTGAANKLDDYEEGTWTPTLGGNTTYHAQSGTYTKIGNLVHVSAVIQANSLGTGSTTTVSGLPFTSNNGGGGSCGGDVGFYYFLATNVMSLDVRLLNGATTVTFSGRSSAGNIMVNPVTAFANGARIDFSVTYLTS